MLIMQLVLAAMGMASVSGKVSDDEGSLLQKKFRQSAVTEEDFVGHSAKPDLLLSVTAVLDKLDATNGTANKSNAEGAFGGPELQAVLAELAQKMNEFLEELKKEHAADNVARASTISHRARCFTQLQRNDVVSAQDELTVSRQKHHKCRNSTWKYSLAVAAFGQTSTCGLPGASNVHITAAERTALAKLSVASDAYDLYQHAEPAGVSTSCDVDQSIDEGKHCQWVKASLGACLGHNRCLQDLQEVEARANIEARTSARKDSVRTIAQLQCRLNAYVTGNFSLFATCGDTKLSASDNEDFEVPADEPFSAEPRDCTIMPAVSAKEALTCDEFLAAEYATWEADVKPSACLSSCDLTLPEVGPRAETCEDADVDDCVFFSHHTDACHKEEYVTPSFNASQDCCDCGIRGHPTGGSEITPPATKFSTFDDWYDAKPGYHPCRGRVNGFKVVDSGMVAQVFFPNYCKDNWTKKPTVLVGLVNEHTWAPHFTYNEDYQGKNSTIPVVYDVNLEGFKVFMAGLIGGAYVLPTWFAFSDEDPHPLPNLCFGHSTKSWTDMDDHHYEREIDTGACGFSSRPVYITSLEMETMPDDAVFMNYIHDVSASSFTHGIRTIGTPPTYTTNFFAWPEQLEGRKSVLCMELDCSKATHCTHGAWLGQNYVDSWFEEWALTPTVTYVDKSYYLQTMHLGDGPEATALAKALPRNYGGPNYNNWYNVKLYMTKEQYDSKVYKTWDYKINTVQFWKPR